MAKAASYISRSMAGFTLITSLLAGMPLCPLSAGQDRSADDRTAPHAILLDVLEDATLSLEDGRYVRLTGLLIPDQALFLAALRTLLPQGTHMRLKDGGRLDRYGILRTDIVLMDGRSLAQGLIQQGAALAYAGPFGLAAPRLWLAERQAENDRRGLWATPDRLILRAAATAGQAKADDGTRGVKLVRARVRSVGVRADWTYLNFGEDWSTDLTIRLSPDVHQALVRDGLDPRGLAGRRVEARGYLTENGGPQMTLVHAANLRPLPEDIDD